MNHVKRCLLVVVAVLLASVLGCVSIPIPPPPGDYVTDNSRFTA